jgi:hypothetical protein
MACRLFRKAVQQGRSERRGESYSVPYVEPLSEARTMLADFVNRLLETHGMAPGRHLSPCVSPKNPLNSRKSILDSCG